MATLRQYFVQMRTARNTAARSFGTYMPATSKELRVAANLGIALQAVLVKLLTDKGIITDAELAAALQAALTDAAANTYDDEPVNP